MLARGTCQILGPNRFLSCKHGIWGLEAVDEEGMGARPRRKGKNTLLSPAPPFFRGRVSLCFLFLSVGLLPAPPVGRGLSWELFYGRDIRHGPRSG